MSETNTKAHVHAIRFYPGGSLVCEGLLSGKNCLVSHGENLYVPEGNSLGWLLDAPASVQLNFVIAPDGTSVNWPELSKSVSADDLMGMGRHRYMGLIEHSWKRKTLRSHATLDELIDCWFESAQWEYIDVRPDGTCAKKQWYKGGSANVETGAFMWSYESPTRFLIHERLFRPQTFNGEVRAALKEVYGRPIPDVIDSITTSYEIKLFDGNVMELIKTWDSGVRVWVMPVWWCKRRRPKDWQIKANQSA